MSNFNKELNQNEILGVGNILFGLGYLFSQFWVIFKFVPAQLDLFNSFETSAPSPSIFYVMSAIFSAIGILNLLIGVKLFKENKSKSLFNQGLIIFIGSIIGIGIYAAISTFLVIIPIYKLTESL